MTYSDYAHIPPNMTLGNNELIFNNVFAEVADEYCGLDVAEQILNEKRAERMVASLLRAMRTVPHDITYWRGASALFLSTDSDWGEVVIADHEEFVNWAGAYPDINAIINAAIERGTHDVDTLKFLVEEDQSHSAVKQGLL